MSTSQNGWPALASGSPLLTTWTIPTGKTPTRLRLRNGSAGFLLAHFALTFDGRVEDLDAALLDDWGYAFRAVRGYSTTLSNHSSGTAMDLNATKHPLGRVGTFSDADEEVIRKVLTHYDGALRWGGTYTGRKDEMHVELNVGLPAAEKVARGLLDTKRGRLILDANPGQRRVILS